MAPVLMESSNSVHTTLVDIDTQGCVNQNILAKIADNMVMLECRYDKHVSFHKDQRG